MGSPTQSSWRSRSFVADLPITHSSAAAATCVAPRNLMPVTTRHNHDNEYTVIVDDGSGTSTHIVTVWPSDVQRYAPETSPEELIEAAFEFLLERESKESILSRFELPVIERYFPEFPSAMAVRFAGSSNR